MSKSLTTVTVSANVGNGLPDSTQHWPNGWYQNVRNAIIFYRSDTDSGWGSFWLYPSGLMSAQTNHYTNMTGHEWARLPEGTVITITVGRETR